MECNHHRTGAGEPLVLIHGIGSRWQAWEPVLPPLAAVHDVIALDLPGFGSSPMPPPGTPPGAAALTSLVAEFLAELGVDSPHVAGNSLGGLIALELAGRGLARSATALSPAGFASPAETAWARSTLWLTARAARLSAPRAEALVASGLGRRLALGQVCARPARVSAADAAASVRALASAPWFDETLPTIGPMAFHPGPASDQVPTTIAWGDRDRVLLPRQARRAAAALPRARVISLRGCGHVPMWDDPAQVADVLLRAARS